MHEGSTYTSNALSEFERVWSVLPPGQALVSTTRDRYDFANVLAYTELQWYSEPLSQYPSKVINSEWVESVFSNSIKGIRSGSIHVRPMPELPSLETTGTVQESTIEDYLCQEERVVYGGILSEIYDARDLSLSQKIYLILSNKLIGHEANATNVSPTTFAPAIESAYERRAPLCFLIPSFPFKDQNPFRTSLDPDTPDLGEIALLIRLHVLALAITQVYPFGCQWIVVSDGVAYSTIFGISPPEARRFCDHLRSYRNKLNLSKTVQFIDLQEMINRFSKRNFESSDYPSDGLIFDEVVNNISSLIQEFCSIKHSPARRKFSILVRGIKWNINTRQFVREYGMNRIWRVLHASSEKNLDKSERELFKIVDNFASESAFKYASFNLALKHCNVLDEMLPGNIRATVHPKRGQIAIPKLGSVDPWNGTPLISGIGENYLSIEVEPLYRHCEKYRIKSLARGGGSFPFCYIKEQPEGNKVSNEN